MGDVCAARCTLPNGTPIVVVTVYISVNLLICQYYISDIIAYIPEILLAYTEGGSKLLGKQYHVLRLILGGDFNIDFHKDEGLRLVQFLKSVLNFDFASGKALGTTRYGTNIDAMVSRFVNHVSTGVPVSYCSYHKPPVAVMTR
ncbi:ATP-dependent DNA helicase [Trichonephila clavipes]|nr:ATP-dependent DNA helicase [Trichonephila clavipes]